MVKKNIYVVGLGFVGYPLFVYLVNRFKNSSHFNKIFAIEKKRKGFQKIKKKIKKGIPLFYSLDKKLNKLAKTKSTKSSIISDKINNQISGVVLICVNFNNLSDLKNLKNLVSKIAKVITEGSTLIIETTLIPGTCEKILYPIFKEELLKRKLDHKKVYFGYSYERVMPGKDYLNSIINNYKSISGINKNSLIEIDKFYKKFLNFKKYRITKFSKITECEAAKILENTYRAVNIALIDEWSKFAYKTGLNLNKIIDSIKVRSTHNNLMRPGIGVGGYCLTKDPKFSKISASKIFKVNNEFPITSESIRINKKMPLFTKKFILKKIKGQKTKKLLIVGYTYKNDVSDTRLSAVLSLRKNLNKHFKTITMLDPTIDKNFNVKLKEELKKNDVILFCIKHTNLKKLNFKNLNFKHKVFDLDYVLSLKQIKYLKSQKVDFFQIGKFN